MEIQKATGYMIDGKNFETISEAKEYMFKEKAKKEIEASVFANPSSPETRDLLNEFMASNFWALHDNINALRKDIFARSKKEKIEELAEDLTESKRENEGVVL